MEKKSFLLFVFILLLNCVNAQYDAYSNEFGVVGLKSSTAKNVKSKQCSQLAGWPKSFSKNPYYVNFRGVCLADVNGDKADDIVFGVDSLFFAYSGDGTLLWSTSVEGVAYYPPTIADINNDGYPEILFFTRAIAGANTSYFYIFSHDGILKDGFPLSYTTPLLMGSPVVADLNDDDMMEIIVSKFGTSQSQLYVYNCDGTIFSDVFPLSVQGRLSVTPSIAYDSHSGELVDDVILCATTSAMYAFDIQGVLQAGFPVEDISVRYSYQSPLICKKSDKINYIAASHGDAPVFISLETDGSFSENWPISTYADAWTYSTPTVSGLGDKFDFILFGQRESEAVLHAIKPNGEYINGFPISREDGTEGVITLMYSTDLSEVYIFTTSISADSEGLGYIHAYVANSDLSNFREMDNSPYSVSGLTYMSAVNLGDINSSGKLDLVVLSYDQGTEADSVHLSVFETDLDFNKNYCYGTYKGRNDRCGYITPFPLENLTKTEIFSNVQIVPNPAINQIEVSTSGFFNVEILTTSGFSVISQNNNSEKCVINIENLKQGIYFAKISLDNKIITKKIVKL